VNAEIALATYIKQNFGPEIGTAKGDVALADSDLARAEDRAEWSKRMREKGFVTAAQQIADELALQRAKFTAKEARTKLGELEKFIQGNTPRELRDEVEKCRSAEADKRSTYERLQARRDD
jgi:HlyD family secretion protein